MSRKAKILLFAGAGLIAAGAFAVVQMRKDRNGRVEVQTAAVERREIVQTVTATGRIQPVTQVDISADVSAKIIRLPVKEGDWVEKGQLLVELDRERYLAEVESAEATLRATQAQAAVARENLEKASKDYERSRDLFEKTVESRASLDSASAAAEKARHRASLDQIEQTRAALKQVRDALSKTTIYAPMTGTVSRLNKEVGEIALGSQFQADVIMEISNLAGMEALVDVDENDIVNVSLGDKAKIEVDALPDTVFEGEVTEIANSAKVSSQGTADQKTEFEVKIAIRDPGARLRPGMTASAEVVTDVHPDALGVPIQSVAVRTPEQLGLGASGKPGEPGKDGAPAPAQVPAPDAPRADKDGFLQVVFVVADGVAHAKPVKTGIQSDTHIELLEGVGSGEQVVVGSYRAISRDLKEGAKVKVVPASGGEGAGGAAGAAPDRG
jgi:HlyD family secretion protein